MKEIQQKSRRITNRLHILTPEIIREICPGVWKYPVLINVNFTICYQSWTGSVQYIFHDPKLNCRVDIDLVLIPQMNPYSDDQQLRARVFGRSSKEVVEFPGSWEGKASLAAIIFTALKWTCAITLGQSDWAPLTLPTIVFLDSSHARLLLVLAISGLRVLTTHSHRPSSASASSSDTIFENTDHDRL